ncbi:MAG: APC family permease [Pseudonocardia sp.]
MRHGAPPGLRRRSPVHGLDRRALGAPEVLAQSVSSAAPAAAMATVPAIVAATAGTATVWSFAVATAVALLVGTCIAQFTRRMAGAGSLYTLTAQGLGTGAAFASASALLVGYALLVMAAVTGAAIYVGALLDRLGVATGSPAVLAVAAALVAAGAAVVVLLGVRLSARTALGVESVSITLIVVVFGVLLAGSVPPVGGPVPDPGLAGIAAGVLPALGAFIGFEAATALGVEARRPYRTVPRAVLWTAAVVGLLCLVAAYVQVTAFGGGRVEAPEPVIAAAAARGSAWLGVVLDLGIAASFLASTVATANALVRVLFSLGRDGVAPRALGVTHRRYRTPHAAIASALPLCGAVPVVLLAAGLPAAWVLSVLLTVASAGYLIAYLLVSVAAPVFLRRIGELTPGPVIASMLVAPVLVAACAAYLVLATGGPVPAVLGSLLVAALAWYAWLRLRRPDALRGIGVYDETSTADVHAWWR